MSTICGILGRCDVAVVRAMASAMVNRGEARYLAEGVDFAVAASTSWEGSPCLIDGAPRQGDTFLDATTLQQLCSYQKDPATLRLQGAFAAAVKVDNSWWLLRDRLGRKPLYYFEGQGFVLFSSELKGILASGLVSRHLNLASVDLYLTLRCVPGTDSIIQGIKRVRPGTVLAYTAGKLTETPFASFEFTTRATARKSAENLLRGYLDQALKRSQTSRILWSAGIDSAALAALKPGYEGLFVALKSSWQNETRQARESARMLDVPLRVAKAGRVNEYMMAKAAWCLDEPVADPTVLPLWMIAEQAAQYGSSYVSGLGADELLGGYPRFHFLQKAHGAKRLVPVTFLTQIAPSLPPNAFVQRGGNYLTSIRDNAESYQSLLAVFDHAEREELYTRAMKAAIYEKGGSVSVLRPHFVHQDLTQNVLSLDLSVGLPYVLLAECDRIMAAHGIEVEYPYLDDELVDFTISLPSKIKYGVRSKSLLRHAMKGLVPGLIRLRARRGFHVPQSGPSLRVIDTFARETITPERVEASGLFRWSHVAQVIASSSHNIYRRRQYWALLMFFAWYREVMEK